MNLIVLLIIIIAVWWVLTRVFGLRKYFGCGMCDDADEWVCGGEARGFPDIYTEPCDASRIAGYNLPRGWNQMCSSLNEGFCGAKKLEGFCGDQRRQCGSQRCASASGMENFSSVEYGRYGSPGTPESVPAVCGPVLDAGCQRPPTCDDCERPFNGYDRCNLELIPKCLQEWKMSVAVPTPSGSCWYINMGQSGTWQAGNDRNAQDCNSRNIGRRTVGGKLYLDSCTDSDQFTALQVCNAWSSNSNPPTTPVMGRCYVRFPLDGGAVSNSTLLNFTKEACDNLGKNCVMDGTVNRGCSNWCANTDTNCASKVTPNVVVDYTLGTCNYRVPGQGAFSQGGYQKTGCAQICATTSNTDCVWCATNDTACQAAVTQNNQQITQTLKLPTSAQIQSMIQTALSEQNMYRSNVGLPALTLTSDQSLLSCTAETARIDAQYNAPFLNDSSKLVGHYRYDKLTGPLNYPCIPKSAMGQENSGFMSYNMPLKGADGFVISSFEGIAKNIIRGFYDSQAHRDTMLNRDFTTCSIGLYCWVDAQFGYNCWLVTDYWKPGAATAPAPTPAPTPVSCQGSWQAGTCSRSCGGGTQTDTYRVSRQAANGGAQCEASDGQTRTNSCNNQPCPVDCQGAWSRGACDCKGGQPESYYITRAAANGGAPCEAAQGTTRTVQTGCVCGNNLYYAPQGSSSWSLLKQNANDADLQWAKNQYPTRCVELAQTQPTKFCPAPSSTGGGSTANLYYTGNGNSVWTLFQSNVPQSSLTQYQAQYPNYCWIWSNSQPTSKCTLGSAPAPSVATANIYSSNPGESVWYLREYQVPQSRLQYWQSNYAGQCWVWSSTQPSNVCALAGGNTGFGNIYWATKGQSQWSMYMDSALQSDLSKYKLQYPNYCWQWVLNTVQPNTPTNVANC